MKKLSVLLCTSALLVACGGGGGGGGGSASATGKVSFGVTDAPVDDAAAVVITIDKVILRRDGAADVVVDRFTVPSLNVSNAETIQLDLLDYRNGNRLLVVNDLLVPAGSYGQLILQVVDNDVNASYVEELSTGLRKPIKQPSGDLKLGGFTVNQDGVYVYTLDFDLRKALTYNPGNNGNGQDRYILKPRGVRLIDQALAAALTGTVDDALFDAGGTACAGKTVPTSGNAVYLYQGHTLAPASLVDIYDPDIAQTLTPPSGAVNPYAATQVYQATDGRWYYNFGFLPAGNYTLAFSCAALGDDADYYNGISIPLPADQKVELTLSAGATRTCNLPIAGGACAP
jgi:hypothetical protein